MQRPESCADQERKVREGFTRLGIAHEDALVRKDEAIPGTRADRPAFTELCRMIQRGEVGVLGVDDQSRFTRADNAFDLIQDLVFNNGRFISTGEGIDTDQPGWELMVKVLEIHHSTSNREKGRQVRRGMEGRLLTGHSPGGFPYGYRSEWADESGGTYTGSGPRPKRRVVVYEPEAQVVRYIFCWFIALMSLRDIARRLNAEGVPPPGAKRRKLVTRRGVMRWSASTVREILINERYIGLWSFGKTTCIRNSKGKKRHKPCDHLAPKEMQNLRLVDQETWERVQARFCKLRAIFGWNPVDSRRRQRIHYSDEYAAGLLNGNLFCGECGSRLAVIRGGDDPIQACPRHLQGACGSCSRIKIKLAEAEILKFVEEIIRGWPECWSLVIDSMRQGVQEILDRTPTELAIVERRLNEIQEGIDRLVSAIRGGTLKIESVEATLAKDEAEKADLLTKRDELKRYSSQEFKIPDDAWFRTKLAELAGLARDDHRRGAKVLKGLLGPITVENIAAPGERRGFRRLRFRLQERGVVEVTLWDQLPPTILERFAVPNDGPASLCSEFCIDLGEPSRMAMLAPVIGQLRAQDKSWTAIAKIVGLTKSPAQLAWKRFSVAQGKPQGPTRNGGTSSSTPPVPGDSPGSV